MVVLTTTLKPCTINRSIPKGISRPTRKVLKSKISKVSAAPNKMSDKFIKKIDWIVLPLIGVGCVLLLWQISSFTWAKELPSPAKTWASSREYILKPFEKRGEMDQGILRFT